MFDNEDNGGRPDGDRSDGVRTNGPRRADGAFARGHSGNPKGRPRRPPMPSTPHGFRDLLISILEEEHLTRVGGKSVRMSMLEALIRKVLRDAAEEKGSHGATKLLDLYQSCARDREAGLAQDLRQKLATAEQVLSSTPPNELDPSTLDVISDIRSLSKPQLVGKAVRSPRRRRSRSRTAVKPA